MVLTMNNSDKIDLAATNEAIRFSITIKKEGRAGVHRVMLGNRCIYSNSSKRWCMDWLDENFPGWQIPDETLEEVEKKPAINKKKGKKKKKK